LATIAVLGAGGWGTALSCHLCDAGHSVTLWSAFADHAAELERDRENKRFLRGKKFPLALAVTADAADASRSADIVVCAVPTPYIRETMERIAAKIPRGGVLVSVSKGIELSTHLRPSEILKEFLPAMDVVVLSGPSHAEEVAKKLPTTVVAACEDERLAKRIQSEFSSETFRVYSSTDMIGVELCGALKNVIGVAVGISDGLGFGDNSKAALMTRGLAEIARLGVALGARESTFRGLAGMGDLITTCVSRFGRNHAFGLSIARGKTLEEAKAAMGGMVAEGVLTSKSALELADRLGVEMPITREVYNILYEGKDQRAAVADLMQRDLKSE